ncbi:MAG TPA: hypothetical protein VKA84_04535 [Gemmatimonadaceae bacterium]|nr:hypothetical protein [Gemmatimonadaceae bacterium]
MPDGSGGGGDTDLTTVRGREAAFRARFPDGRLEADARPVRGGAAVRGVAVAWRAPDDPRPARAELTLRAVGAGDAIRERSLERVRELVVGRVLAELLGIPPAATAAAAARRGAARVREPAPGAAVIAAASADVAIAPPDPRAAQVAALLDAARRAGLPPARAAALRERLLGGAAPPPPGALDRAASLLRRWVVGRHDERLGGA